MRDVGAYVGGADRGHPPAAEVRCQVLIDPPFEFIDRSAVVDAVFVLQVLGGIVETKTPNLRRDRKPSSDVALAKLQQFACDLFS